MAPDALERSLIEAMTGFEIIDAHEHLPPEACRTAAPVDVFTLFSHYTHGDLRAAGMSEAQYQSLSDRSLPLEQRWATFAPYLDLIRQTSYTRAAFLAAERFYGVTDINEQTYAPLSEAMQAANTPGIYERVLRDACHIRTALTQCNSTDLGTPLLTPVMPMYDATSTWEEVSRPEYQPDTTIRSLDDYLAMLHDYVVRVKQQGTVGMKMLAHPFAEPDRRQAVAAFESLRSGEATRLPHRNPLYDYVMDRAVAFATELDLTIAVHTGYWGDFRTLDPLHMIPVLQRHPRARFDIYHLGYPWMRETLMLAKGFPNVWLNLAWTHVISQRFACDGIDEAIDLLPANKVLAFGGDYRVPVEKVYGHLVMAREDIASVLARRIERGRMSEAQALELAHRWFWDNPRDLYRLQC
ncbi:MAG: amidohydrolase family protein [Anaerolineae bacterium]